MFTARGVDTNALFGTVQLPFAIICNSTDAVPQVVELSGGKKILKFKVLANDMIGREKKVTIDCEITEESIVERCLKNHLIYPGGQYNMIGCLKTVERRCNDGLGGIEKVLVCDISGLFKCFHQAKRKEAAN